MFGSPYIETEHLLLGLFREDKALANQFLTSYATLEAMRRSIEQRAKMGPKIPTSIDLPLSHECKRALAYAAEESVRLNHKHIGTPHLLLGLLREEKSFAAQLLHEQGLTLDSLRTAIQNAEPPSSATRSASGAGIDQWLAEREASGSVWAVKQERVGNRSTHFAIYGGPQSKDDDNIQNPPPRVPLLCIDIIRDDRFSEVQLRCDDYIAEGVSEVWLLEPDSKRAYTVTKTEGLREFKGEVLKIASPPLEMDLKKVFE